MIEPEDDGEFAWPFMVTGRIDYQRGRVIVLRDGLWIGEVPLSDYMEAEKHQGEFCLACKLGLLEDLGVDRMLRLCLGCGRCGKVHMLAGGELCLMGLDQKL